MKKTKKCFGIVSWFPEEEPARSQRQDRLNRLLKQLSILWPTIDILLIAQNWGTFKNAPIKNKLEIINFESGLGILKARQTLRNEFLKRSYDYIIMFDDDAILTVKDDTHLEYMRKLDEHPKGFCFIKNQNLKKTNSINPYKAAQLNLCAISRFIFEKEPIPEVDPQKKHGYEDEVYAMLLHMKYSKYEFDAPDGIEHIQFNNRFEIAPSTWTNNGDWTTAANYEKRIIDFIIKNKDLPDLNLLYEKDIIIKRGCSKEQIALVVGVEERRKQNKAKNKFFSIL